MQLVSIILYRNFGQKQQKTINNVIPTGINTNYVHNKNRLILSYDYMQYGHKFHSYEILEPGSTFMITHNNIFSE